ncbi:hypothetical protein VL23_16475 [Stenotrophomonas maltophilia]|uniref:LysR substrate-binding domain-containing protein n=1 Tax=Stenotrophomonas maltophilia TaxID=40324 RepID=A0AB34TF09_STEMA|nr:hypothetical protein VL23_16475 [Stenotrophomonas maltophilia]
MQAHRRVEPCVDDRAGRQVELALHRRAAGILLPRDRDPAAARLDFGFLAATPVLQGIATRLWVHAGRQVLAGEGPPVHALVQHPALGPSAASRRQCTSR